MSETINKNEVIEFFDERAAGWDSDLVHNDAKIARILDAAGVTEGKSVLDVACGTGVLFPDYFARNVGRLVGADISPKMLEEAGRKFTDSRLELICGDVQEIAFAEPFDCVVIYNAFPHFPNPELLIEKMAAALKPGGSLTIAHGSGRAAIDAHHHGCASHVSLGLMEADKLAAIMGRHFDISSCVSEDDIYFVSGTKKV